MLNFINNHINHFLCFALLISRLGDIISTRLVTPKMRLEANPLVRWLGWPFAYLTVLACLVPYADPKVGATLLAPFLLVSASNSGKIWIARTLGEDEYANFMLWLASRSRLRSALIPALASAGFITFLGLVMMVLCPDPDSWGYAFALGIIAYGAIIAFFSTISLIRMFRSIRAKEVYAVYEEENTTE